MCRVGTQRRGPFRGAQAGRRAGCGSPISHRGKWTIVHDEWSPAAVSLFSVSHSSHGSTATGHRSWRLWDGCACRAPRAHPPSLDASPKSQLRQALARRRAFVEVAPRVLSIFGASRQPFRSPTFATVRHVKRDLTFAMVSSSNDLEEVMLGDGGLFTGQSSPRVIAHASTVSGEASALIREAANSPLRDHAEHEVVGDLHQPRPPRPDRRRARRGRTR
jgi:hypothetical protein